MSYLLSLSPVTKNGLYNLEYQNLSIQPVKFLIFDFISNVIWDTKQESILTLLMQSVSFNNYSPDLRRMSWTTVMNAH